MNEQECDGEYDRKHHQRKHAVGPAPPPFEVRGGARKICEGVYVREIGAGDERGGAKCRPLGEAAPRQRGTNQGMTERVYSRIPGN